MNGHWQPLAFFNKQLRDAERNYSTFGREMLAQYLSLRHFRFLVEGSSFTIFTNHKPLVDNWTARQQCQLLLISSFTTDIEHISDKNNVVTDWFSRAVISDVSMGIDVTAMSAAQVVSEEIQA